MFHLGSGRLSPPIGFDVEELQDMGTGSWRFVYSNDATRWGIYGTSQPIIGGASDQCGGSGPDERHHQSS